MTPLSPCSFLKLWVLWPFSHTAIIACSCFCHSFHLPYHESFKGRARSSPASCPYSSLVFDNLWALSVLEDLVLEGRGLWQCQAMGSLWVTFCLIVERSSLIKLFSAFFSPFKYNLFSAPDPKLLKRYIFLEEYLENINNHP